MKYRVGAASLFALGVNGIVGVGIFFTPNLVAGLVPGSAGALAYLATAALLLPVALTFSLLGGRLAVDGGPYIWAREAFGEAAAFGVGWVAAVSSVLSTAAVVSGLRDHLGASLLVPAGLGRVAFAWLCVGVLSWLASSGLRPSAFTWDGLTLLKLVPLALLLTLLFASHPAATSNAAPDTRWARALLIVVFPLQGFEIVPVLAGSARSARSIAMGTLGSLVFSAVLYAAIQLVCTRALPDLAVHATPLPDAARALGGAFAAHVVSFGTNLSALATAFGMIVMTPRYVAALGSEGAPSAWLGRYDERGVPQSALWLSALCIGALASSEKLAALFALSSAAVLVQYIAAAGSLAWLSFRRRLELRPSAMAPALLGLFAVALLARAVEPAELPILGVALLLGAFAFLARKPNQQKSP